MMQESGLADHLGMFAIACMGCDEMVKKFEAMNDDYSKIMVQVFLVDIYTDTKRLFRANFTRLIQACSALAWAMTSTHGSF